MIPVIPACSRRGPVPGICATGISVPTASRPHSGMVAVLVTASGRGSAAQTGFRNTHRKRLTFRRPFSRRFQVSLTGRIAQGRDSAAAEEAQTLTLGEVFPGIVPNPSGQAWSVVADHSVMAGRSATGTTQDEQERDTQTGDRGQVDSQFHSVAFHSLPANLHKAVIVTVRYHPPEKFAARFPCSFPVNHSRRNKQVVFMRSIEIPARGRRSGRGDPGGYNRFHPFAAVSEVRRSDRRGTAEASSPRCPRSRGCGRVSRGRR